MTTKERNRDLTQDALQLLEFSLEMNAKYRKEIDALKKELNDLRSRAKAEEEEDSSLTTYGLTDKLLRVVVQSVPSGYALLKWRAEGASFAEMGRRISVHRETARQRYYKAKELVELEREIKYG